MTNPKACQVSSFFRVIVTGCRHSYWIATARRAVVSLSKTHDGLVIVHGGAMGIDKAFGDACRDLRIAVDIFPADWDRYGKGAGPIRNQAMVDAKASMCLAFHPDLAGSKGTGDCVRKAMAANIPVWLKSEDKEGVRPRLLKQSDNQNGWEFAKP